MKRPKKSQTIFKEEKQSGGDLTYNIARLIIQPQYLNVLLVHR